MADNKKFILKGLINAGDSRGDGELAINELDASDGSFEVDCGDFKNGVTGGVGER